MWLDTTSMLNFFCLTDTLTIFPCNTNLQLIFFFHQQNQLEIDLDLEVVSKIFHL